MEPEYAVLNHLHENEITTQRKISKRTGLSLGAVNLLLKKMARKGLIKIEKLNARNVRYVLTPQGLHEKSRLAYRYIRQSYKQIIRINQAMDQLIAERAEAIDGEAIILCGPKDEIMEILMEYLNHQDLLFEVCPEAGLSTKPDLQNSRLILIWREEEEKLLGDCHQVVNLMNII
jgi:DNA-binding MarR family transcriptional regulator